EIVALTGASTQGEGAGFFSSVAPLEVAGPQDISFFDNILYKDHFVQTKAGACFVRPSFAALAPAGTVALVTDTPYKAFALTAQKLFPVAAPAGQVHPGAFVHPTAQLGAGVDVGPGAVIEERAQIGEDTVVGPQVVIGAGVVLGKQCHIGAHASISHSLIGDHVRIYPGARIGQDGFGFAIDPSGFVKVPQLGRVVIGNHVEIGANTTIDRGAGPDTTIGDGTWIDNLVQIGHNVKIGRGCVIVAQVGISGSTVIGDYVMLGGQVGIAGHLKIGAGARIAAQSGIMRDVDAKAEMMGYPAMPMKSFLRQVAFLKRLVNKTEGKTS
ncbi:MAG: UDP-3-O-(3-hydroxymyristoyl)glucosamine N-acyltransferase, partial [Alphaproteobacteria bacterium]|nr:UDP-3-O-(3-hydroxymyristoyl)glucosamine N-acyltransferase [Alphaproteobacteria bacterium]